MTAKGCQEVEISLVTEEVEKMLHQEMIRPTLPVLPHQVMAEQAGLHLVQQSALDR